ncbi:hypothetical protein M918_09235 [Clostridium sp. BL8]|nr:hypothetical protein M918_09235 [Clostridium sp. BL8]
MDFNHIPFSLLLKAPKHTIFSFQGNYSLKAKFSQQF